MKKKIIIATNNTWSVINYRSGLIQELNASGYEIVIMADSDDSVDRLKKLNYRFIEIKMDSVGTNPIRDFVLLGRFYFHLKKEKPDIFMSYTVKPNVFGSLAAHILGISVINTVNGLGTAFYQDNWLTKVVQILYRVAVKKSKKIIFHNNDDRDFFIEKKITTRDKTMKVPGSGVNLSHFSKSYNKDVSQNKKFYFILIARMLWDKGIGEYIGAARLIKSYYPDVEIALLGFLEGNHPAAISKNQIKKWIDEGVVDFHGWTDDVRPFLHKADCVVLPSCYKEGIPRTLLEAAAMYKPIITTNATGCRETVEDGFNGYLCKSQSVVDLADKMEKMFLLSPESRAEMGRNGRKKVAREFDEKIVIQKYKEVIQQALSSDGVVV